MSGLPNVGKSTLFNALTQTAAAQAANYPFCTIEPNVGEVAVPDARLDALAKIAAPQRSSRRKINFVDIAGLVSGASKGEGLGNQFLGHIREVDAIVHVLRCFEDGDITHVEGGIDPVARRRNGRNRTDARRSREPREAHRQPAPRKRAASDKEAIAQLDLVKRSIEVLSNGKPARAVERNEEEEPAFQTLQLITAKPVLYVCNVDEGSAATGNEFVEEGRSERESPRTPSPS